MLITEKLIEDLTKLRDADVAVTLTAADKEKIVSALDYVWIDGGHHKQYALEQIAEVFGLEHDSEGIPA